jgi:glutamate 5-kinase
MKRRICVVKVGTESLIKAGKFRHWLISDIAKSIAKVRRAGVDVIVISSGAVRLGEADPMLQEAMRQLGKNAIDDQIKSVVGQSRLVETWKRSFARHNILSGQLLYTHLLLGNCVEVSVDNELNRELDRVKAGIVEGLFKFLDVGMVPVINENDGVSTEEIREILSFGDNDNLARLVAQAVGAELTIFITTVKGVEDPSTGELIEAISHCDWTLADQITSRPGERKGGMRSKVLSAMDIVCKVPESRAFIAPYWERGVINRILAGEKIGTMIYDSREVMKK